MSTLKGILEYMFTPKLITIYESATIQRAYQPLPYEKLGDKVIHSFNVFWKIGVYTSPFIVGILYHHGYLNGESLIPISKFVTSIGVILIVSFCCRGAGRYNNSTYRKFLETLEAAHKNLTRENKKQLLRYDFEFDRWPIEFKPNYETSEFPKKKINIPKPYRGNMIQNILYIPFRIIAYVAIHTFGIRLIYPGSMGFLQSILERSLQEGRCKLVKHLGERFKLETVDNNTIDTMFFDRRKKTQKGNILVVCCEGNAGFYEFGILMTPLEADYSVLGWNHPGFRGSTGMPYPSQEQNAIDAVMQFAINKLQFKLDNIILFGWSIGGYSASWAAMSYPDVKGIVLDATFDDLLPLALTHMPTWCSLIVRLAIREHVDLNIFSQLAFFPGPVLLIRRTDDEVICLKENNLLSNRGNNLLIKLLEHRYPFIVGQQQIDLMKEYLAVSSPEQDEYFERLSVNDRICCSLIQTYISEYSKTYPMKIGIDFNNEQKNQMVLFLARKYLKDFNSTHCINLPYEMFELPWDINVESDYVFT